MKVHVTPARYCIAITLAYACLMIAGWFAFRAYASSHYAADEAVTVAMMMEMLSFMVTMVATVAGAVYGHCKLFAQSEANE